MVRAVAERAGPWNESFVLNDDGEYFCRVVLASQGVKFCAGARVFYRSGNLSSLSYVHSHEKMVRCLESMVLSTGYLLEREDSPRTRRASANMLRQFVYWIYKYEVLRDIVDKAEGDVQRLGGSSLKPGGGPLFQLLVRLVGWRRALDVKYLVRPPRAEG